MSTADESTILNPILFDKSMRTTKRREPGDYTDGKKFGDNAWNKDLPLGAKRVKRQPDSVREAHPGPG